MPTNNVFTLQGEGGKQLKLTTRQDIAPYLQQLEAIGHELEEVHLGGNSLGTEACQALAEVLSTKKSLKVADFADIFTGRLISEIPEALRALCDALISTESLVELNLSDNAFGGRSAEPMVRLLTSNPHLRILKLANNGLGITGGTIVATALLEAAKELKRKGLKSNLRTVICGRNRLENGSAPYWAQAFEAHGALEEVRMYQNGIRMEGIEAIVKALTQCPTLKILDLMDNTATLKGSRAIAACLPAWPNLHTLNLNDCLLRPKGGALVAAALAKGNNKNLAKLQLGYCELDAKALSTLAGAISQHLDQLESLEINGNWADEEDECIEAIKKALAKHGNEDALDELDDLDPDGELDESEDEAAEEEEEEEEKEEKGAEGEEKEEESGPLDKAAAVVATPAATAAVAGAGIVAAVENAKESVAAPKAAEPGAEAETSSQLNKEVHSEAPAAASAASITTPFEPITDATESTPFVVLKEASTIVDAAEAKDKEQGALTQGVEHSSAANAAEPQAVPQEEPTYAEVAAETPSSSAPVVVAESQERAQDEEADSLAKPIAALSLGTAAGGAALVDHKPSQDTDEDEDVDMQDQTPAIEAEPLGPTPTQEEEKAAAVADDVAVESAKVISEPSSSSAIASFATEEDEVSINASATTEEKDDVEMEAPAIEAEPLGPASTTEEVKAADIAADVAESAEQVPEVDAVTASNVDTTVQEADEEVIPQAVTQEQELPSSYAAAAASAPADEPQAASLESIPAARIEDQDSTITDAAAVIREEQAQASATAAAATPFEKRDATHAIAAGALGGVAAGGAALAAAQFITEEKEPEVAKAVVAELQPEIVKQESSAPASVKQESVAVAEEEPVTAQEESLVVKEESVEASAASEPVLPALEASEAPQEEPVAAQETPFEAASKEPADIRKEPVEASAAFEPVSAALEEPEAAQEKSVVAPENPIEATSEESAAVKEEPVEASNASEVVVAASEEPVAAQEKPKTFKEPAPVEEPTEEASPAVEASSSREAPISEPISSEEEATTASVSIEKPAIQVESSDVSTSGAPAVESSSEAVAAEEAPLPLAPIAATSGAFGVGIGGAAAVYAQLHPSAAGGVEAGASSSDIATTPTPSIAEEKKDTTSELQKPDGPVVMQGGGHAKKSSVDLSGELFTATNSKLSTHGASSSSPAAATAGSSKAGATDYAGATDAAADPMTQRKPRKSLYKAAMGAVRALLR